MALNLNELRTTMISFSQDGWFMNWGLKARPVECKVAVLPTRPTWSQQLQDSSFAWRIAFERRAVTFTAERRIVDIYTTDRPQLRTAVQFSISLQMSNIWALRSDRTCHWPTAANTTVATLSQLHLRLTNGTCLFKTLLTLSSNSPDVKTLQQLTVDIGRFSFSLLTAGWLSWHSNWAIVFRF
jgi:hypothetical protein